MRTKRAKIDRRSCLDDPALQQRYITPNIHPSTCATARSGGVRSGLRNAARLPSRSARRATRQCCRRHAGPPCGRHGRSCGSIAPDRPRQWPNASRNVPAIERPEMRALAPPLADEAQPRNSRMGGFCYRSLHVEMETPISRRRRVLRSTAASERFPCARLRCPPRHHGRNRRRCFHRSANGAENHQGRRASQA